MVLEIYLLTVTMFESGIEFFLAVIVKSLEQFYHVFVYFSVEYNWCRCMYIHAVEN